MKTTNLAWSLLLLPLLAGCPTRYVGGDEDGGTGGGAGSESKGGHAGSATGSSGAGGKGNATGGAAGTSPAGTGGIVSTGGTLGSGGGGGGAGSGPSSTGGGAGRGSGGAGTGGSSGSAGRGSGGSGTGGSATGGVGAGGSGHGGSGTGGAGTGGGPGSGAATGGSGTGGAAGQAAGGSGAGGSSACTDTSSDSHNCGTCGHDCLGASCSGGVCQPLLLGTIPVSDFADEMVVLNGKVYVFSDTSQTGKRTDLWLLDANAPGTPTEVTTNGTVSCIIGGQLFWITSDNPAHIMSCTLSNCAATTTPVVALAAGYTFGGPVRCDPAANELVWTSTSDSSDFAINRASTTGANQRLMTTLTFPNDSASWNLLDSGTQATRLFYTRGVTTVGPSGTTGTAALYYIATNAVNAAGVQIATFQNGQLGNVLPSDSVTLVSEYLFSTNAYQELSVPLPNGIVSGTVPVFAPGFVVAYGGVIDQTTFYGFFSSNSAIPTDAIVTCPLSSCASPTILFRGQSHPSTFTQDSKAIYWTTNAFTQSQGFSVWKAAK